MQDPICCIAGKFVFVKLRHFQWAEIVTQNVTAASQYKCMYLCVSCSQLQVYTR